MKVSHSCTSPTTSQVWKRSDVRSSRFSEGHQLTVKQLKTVAKIYTVSLCDSDGRAVALM